MLAAEEKLINNNFDFVLEVLRSLHEVREDGGYGSVTGKVENGKVVFVTYEVRKHINKKA